MKTPKKIKLKKGEKHPLDNLIKSLEEERKNKECTCEDYKDACSKCGGDKFN